MSQTFIDFCLAYETKCLNNSNIFVESAPSPISSRQIYYKTPRSVLPRVGSPCPNYVVLTDGSSLHVPFNIFPLEKRKIIVRYYADIKYLTSRTDPYVQLSSSCF